MLSDIGLLVGQNTTFFYNQKSKKAILKYSHVIRKKIILRFLALNDMSIEIES